MEERAKASRQVESVTLLAEDGYRLAARKYVADEPARAHLIVAGATGVPQGFYQRFAVYARERGFTVLTLDYRGIGLSRPEKLKQLNMSYLDWGRLDLAAAVDEMAQPRIPLFIVGHSFGGHAFGLLPNHRKVAGLYTFATGAGWHGWMPRRESLRVRLLWHLVLSPLTLWKGYTPGKMLGIGEDLPAGVFWQWRHWCRFPHYFFDDPAMPGMSEQYATVTSRIVAANALDDLWALPRSRNAFMQAYRNASLSYVDIDPQRFDGNIGHMGYFREKSKPLWDEVLACFANWMAKPV
ncbi:MAG: alpha/beta fold hydrolase [Paraburkholderia sp.]|uniref:alpha/beta hydrolase family protein n=1 Tax=Burkholderiaceae TaxID=119060 RepID=UPI0010F56F7D|nr:alpha/beta fold hydrolase [Burkholderia sp. 4M9327F10]